MHTLLHLRDLHGLALSIALYTSHQLTRNRTHIPTHHHYIIPPLLSAPYLLTYLCATSTASLITPSNHSSADSSNQYQQHHRHYPYDHTLYHPSNPCRTCLTPKPARSKHCPLCRTCVARLDHHCVWVNNCIGLANYRWFLSLLLSLGILLSYGAYLAYQILRVSSAFDNGNGSGLGSERQRSWWQSITLAISLNINVGGVGLLALFTAPLAWGMLLYHLYLIWAGMTTNETGKWRALGEDIDEGGVWSGVRDAASLREDEGCEWPRVSEQVVVVMEDRRHPETLRMSGVVPSSWRGVWGLHELDNLYDLGFWRNLRDALDIR